MSPSTPDGNSDTPSALDLILSWVYCSPCSGEEYHQTHPFPETQIQGNYSNFLGPSNDSAVGVILIVAPPCKDQCFFPADSPNNLI